MWTIFMISIFVTVVLCRVFDHDRIADQTEAYYGSLAFKRGEHHDIRIF